MSRPADDSTKPSRINRKRKRRWKAVMIAGLIKSGLTDCYRVAILYALLPHGAVGIYSPRKGEKSPLTSAVFLCPLKIGTGLFRVKFIMVDCLREALKSLAGSFAGTVNLIQSTAQRFTAIGGGLSLYKGIPQ